MARPIVFASLLLGAALVACRRQDPRFEKLTAGIPKDSAISLIGPDKPQRTDPYLINGQYIEAIYYAKPGAEPGKKTEDRKLSPVVIVNGRLAAWGWKRWDSIAAANKIVVAH